MHPIRRTSSFGGRRLSGKARRCSARIGKENQGNADELADDSSKFPGASDLPCCYCHEDRGRSLTHYFDWNALLLRPGGWHVQPGESKN